MGLSSVQFSLKAKPFLMSGFSVMFLRCGEFGAKTPLHFTRWDFGGGMMALSFSMNSVGVNSRCEVPSEYPVFSFSFTLPDCVISRRSFERGPREIYSTRLLRRCRANALVEVLAWREKPLMLKHR